MKNKHSFHLSFGHSDYFWLVLFIVLAVLGLYIPGSLLTKSGELTPFAPVQALYSYKERALPIYSVQTDEPSVALTFDTAWGSEDLFPILDILKKHRIKATFFVTGECVKMYPEAIHAIVKDGHDLASHGDAHAYMTHLSYTEIVKDIQSCHEKVKTLTGIEMDLYRPPYGDYNDDVIHAADYLHYYTIQWSVDSLDWKNYGKADIIDRVLTHKKLKNGAIILLHNGTTYTKDALDELITGLQEKGYEFVPVSQLIYRDQYIIDNEGTQHPNTLSSTAVQ